MAGLAVNILVGLVGALAGGFVTWFVGVRQRRAEPLLAMHEQLHSVEMIGVRHRATELLDAHPGLSLRDLRLQVGRTTMTDVWSVQYFYQRLWLLVRHNQVQRSLVPELFGDLFTLWVERYFATRLFPLDTEPARHVHDLWIWLGEHSTADQRDRWSRQIDTYPGPGTPPPAEPRPPEHP